MTSLELHEYMTPEQHARWSAMPEDVYLRAKTAVDYMLLDGVGIHMAINMVDERYSEYLDLKEIPF